MTTSATREVEGSAPIHGPWRKRTCTNPCFLFVFVLFLIAWAFLFVIAARYADPERIIYPSDSKGRICGRNELSDRPYLYFFNILKCAKLTSALNGCDTPMICVSNCPNYTVSFAGYKSQFEWQKLSLERKTNVVNTLICDYNVKPTIDEVPQLLKNKNCSSIYFNEEPLGGRCIPIALKRFGKNEIKDDFGKALMDEENNDPVKVDKIRETTKGLALLIKAKAIGERIVEDIAHSWKFILIGMVFAMIVSFIWIMLMQVIAGFMVWTSMLTMIVLSAFAFQSCLQKFLYFNSISSDELDQLETDRLDQDINIDMTHLIKVQIDALLADKRLWLIFTVVSGIAFLILSITFVFLRKRVHIAISLIREASKAIWHAKFALIFPVFPYILQSIVIIFFGFTALLITAAVKPSYRYGSGPKYGLLCNFPLNSNEKIPENCQMMQIAPDNWALAAHCFNLFGLLWLIFFVKGLCQMIFAGTFARYYWTWNKRKNVPECLILTSTYTTLRYHLGSVALGSFLLATVNFIRCIIEYIDRKCRRYPNNELVRAITCMFRCCFWCLDHFLRFLNTNAYIMVAIYGKGFFSSAKDAFSLLLDNIVRVIVIDQVADYLLLMGKLSVTSFVGVVSYYIFHGYVLADKIAPYLPNVTYSFVPIVAIIIGTYLIACSFFSVYDMAVDTIFLCFLKDCKVNDGSADRPYFMSKELMRILNYKNKLIQELSKSKSDNPSDQ